MWIIYQTQVNLVGEACPLKEVLKLENLDQDCFGDEIYDKMIEADLIESFDDYDVDGDGGFIAIMGKTEKFPDFSALWFEKNPIDYIDNSDPTWSITHELARDDDENLDVTCNVWKFDHGELADEVVYVFGYTYDWGHTCDGFYEFSISREFKVGKEDMTARQYSMNGGGDVAVHNDIPWNEAWLEWVNTGEEKHNSLGIVGTN